MTDPILTHCRYHEAHCGDMLFEGFHIVEAVYGQGAGYPLVFSFEGEEGRFCANPHAPTAVFRREDWNR